MPQIRSKKPESGFMVQRDTSPQQREQSPGFASLLNSVRSSRGFVDQLLRSPPAWAVLPVIQALGGKPAR
jgi:hypothetical protein